MEASVSETVLDLTDTVETVDDLDLKCSSDVGFAVQKTVESKLPVSHLENLWQVHDRDASGYSPSAPTDSSGFLPGISVDSDLQLVEKYDPDSMVRAAWKSLQPTVPKLPWEGNFWDRFLDPNVSAMDMLESSFKRPLPAPVVSEQFKGRRDQVPMQREPILLLLEAGDRQRCTFVETQILFRSCGFHQICLGN